VFYNLVSLGRIENGRGVGVRPFTVRYTPKQNLDVFYGCFFNESKPARIKTKICVDELVWLLENSIKGFDV